MIPKKLHFCWLSGDEYPPLIKHCIDTWHEVLPDYELVLWDTKRFDIDSMPWVKEAFEARKYAFAADYIRLYSVYTEGGIYLDSDVEVLKSFNDLLQHKSFIGFEASTDSVEAAIFGAEPGSEWCRKGMEWYQGKHLHVDEKGRVNAEVIAPNVFRSALQATYPDFPSEPPVEPVMCGGKEGIYVCPADYFSPLKYDLDKSRGGGKQLSKKYRSNPHTYCIHRFNDSWGTGVPMYLRVWDYVKRRFLKRK